MSRGRSAIVGACYKSSTVRVLSLVTRDAHSFISCAGTRLTRESSSESGLIPPQPSSGLSQQDSGISELGGPLDSPVLVSSVRAAPLGRVTVIFTVKNAVCCRRRILHFDCEFEFDSLEWRCSQTALSSLRAAPLGRGKPTDSHIRQQRHSGESMPKQIQYSFEHDTHRSCQPWCPHSSTTHTHTYHRAHTHTHTRVLPYMVHPETSVFVVKTF